MCPAEHKHGFTMCVLHEVVPSVNLYAIDLCANLSVNWTLIETRGNGLLVGGE